MGIPDRGFSEASELLFENNKKIASKIFGEEIGILKYGALADLVIMDYRPYTKINDGNINGHMMFGMSGGMTDTTIINGKILMRNRKMCFVDEERLLKESAESAKDLWSRL